MHWQVEFAALITGKTVTGDLVNRKFAFAALGLPFLSVAGLKIIKNPEIQNTLARISNNQPKYKRDGITFHNKEGLLPKGSYTEWTVDTPGATNRGAQRIVVESSGSKYYTPDHYKSFKQIE